MVFDHSIFSVYCNSRKVTHMLFGTGQLVKQCRLSTILISHKSKRQCLPFRQRSLLFPVMKLSAFPISRMQFLLFFYFFSGILWFVFFTDFNVFASSRRSSARSHEAAAQLDLPSVHIVQPSLLCLVSIPYPENVGRRAPSPPTERMVAVLPICNSFNFMSFPLSHSFELSYYSTIHWCFYKINCLGTKIPTDYSAGLLLF